MSKDAAIDVQSSIFTSGPVGENLTLYLAFGSAKRLERELIGLQS